MRSAGLDPISLFSCFNLQKISYSIVDWNMSVLEFPKCAGNQGKLDRIVVALYKLLSSVIHCELGSWRTPAVRGTKKEKQSFPLRPRQKDAIIHSKRAAVSQRKV